jgi:hypothetical protein
VIKAMQQRGATVRVLWRFATGAHLDGQLRTDAGWIKRGEQDLTPNQKASPWARLPRATRAGIRWGAVAGIALRSWGTVTGSSIPGTIAEIAGIGAVCAALIMAPLAVRRAQHRRRWVLPLFRSIGKLVGWTASTRPESVITIPRNFKRVGSVIRLAFPADWADSAQHRQAVNNAVVNNLGLYSHELDIRYTAEPAAAYATFTVADAAERYLRVVQPRQDHGTGGGHSAAV